MRHTFSRAAIVAGLLLSAASAGAQSIEPPFRALFATGKQTRHQLDLAFSVYEDYGDNLASVPVEIEIDGVPTATSETVPVEYHGALTGVQSGLSYTYRTRRTTLSLTGAGDLVYGRDRSVPVPIRYTGGMVLGTTLGKRGRTRLYLDGAFEKTPFYRLPALPDTSEVAFDQMALGVDMRYNGLFRRAAHVHDWTLVEEQQLTERSSVFFRETIKVVAFREETPCHCDSLRDLSGAVGFRRSFGRGLAVRVGYEYRNAQYGIEAKLFRAHNVDAGLEYQHALTRRTTLSFETGSSLIKTRFQGREFRAVGAAMLQFKGSDRWALQAQYRRGVEALEGATVPLLSDTVSGGAVAYLGRRVELAGSAGYSFGNVGFGPDKYEHLQASARMRVALARWLALDTQYLYYHHDMADALYYQEFYSRLDRAAVRVNLAVWLPLLR